LEKRPVAGGKLSAWRDREGDWLESGLQTFFGGFTGMLQLLADVGISQNVLWQPHTFTWALPRGFSPRWNRTEPVVDEMHCGDFPAPFNVIGALLSGRYVLSAIEKVLLASGVLPALLGNRADAEAYDDVTYADWHRKRGMSEHMLRTFFAPLSLALNFTRIDRISAGAMLRVMGNVFSSKNASRMGVLNAPSSLAFVDPLVEHVRARGQDVELSSGVAELIFENGRVAGARTRDGREYRAEATILAVPVHDAATLLPAGMLRDPLVRGLVTLTSSPVINAHLWFDRPISHLSNVVFAPGSIVPKHADLGQASPGYAWRGKSFIEVCVAPADDLMKMDDATVIERVLTDMRKLYPLAKREHVVKATLVRVPKSVYRASPGAQRLRPGAQTPISNLFLAGCYTNQTFPASMEGAIRSAKIAAQCAAERVGART
jgi:uncharacterized protein with NAD-binding domain and iron-sulfur cluster